MNIKKRYYITLLFLVIFSLSFSQNENTIDKENNNAPTLKSSEQSTLNVKDSVAVDSNKNSKSTPTLSPYSVTPVNSDNVKMKGSKTHTSKKVELKSQALYTSEKKHVNEVNKKNLNETN